MTAQPLGDLFTRDSVAFAPEGEAPKRMNTAFFRGESCNFNPYLVDYAAPDFFARFVMKGWAPEAPFIDAETIVTAFGSCFASEITNHLAGRGYRLTKERAGSIYISGMSEGLVNVYALLQQFEWALEGITPPTNLWHGYKAEEFGYDEAIREKTRAAMLETDVFIITAGLSEIWFDEVTGGVFWRAVPMAAYDPVRHKFRVCSVAETKAAFQRMVDIIAKHVPRARVVFTISPIPLVATFRPVSCPTANSASKAIIRAALDEVMRENAAILNDRLFYFPSFDLITDYFPHRFIPDGRHVHPYIVPAMMHLFESYYCVGGTGKAEAERILSDARAKSAASVVPFENGSGPF